MGRDIDDKADPEMLENLDLLLDLDIVEKESDWDLLDEWNEDFTEESEQKDE